MKKSEKTEKNDFEIAIGDVLKGLLLDKNKGVVANGVNNVLEKFLSPKQLGNDKCSSQKLTRYCTCATSLPPFALAAICEYLEISTDSFFSKVYEKIGYKRKSLEYVVSSYLDEGLENVVIDFDNDIHYMEQEFIKCISDKKLKSKFGYYGENVTRAYLDLISSPHYEVHNKTAALLQGGNLNAIVNKVTESQKPIRLVSLGIGDGHKDSLIIRKLASKVEGTIEYWVFDISMDMIAEGLKTIKTALPKEFRRLDRRMHLVDFMDIDKIFKKISEDSSKRQNLFLLLGNTLGNFPEDALLGKIKNVLKSNDILLVDNQIVAKEFLDKRLPEYENKLKGVYDTEKGRNYIRAILKPLNISIPDDEIVTEVIVNPDIASLAWEPLRDNCIAVVHIYKPKSAIHLTAYGQDAGQHGAESSIAVSFSKKYTKKALLGLLSQYFSIEDKGCFYTEEDDYALILCKVKK